MLQGGSVGGEWARSGKLCRRLWLGRGARGGGARRGIVRDHAGGAARKPQWAR